MKYLYIVLVQANTGLGRIVRCITGYHFTHVSVCLNDRFDDFISFSRRRHYLPFDAGFMHEKRDFYAFGKHRKCKVKIFKLPLEPIYEKRVKRFMNRCEHDKMLRFNLFSMITMPLLHGIPIYKAYNCMSFTAKIIALSGAVTLQRRYWQYDIKEIDMLLKDFFYAEGYLRRISSQEYEKYMEKPSAVDYIRYSAGLITELTRRMISQQMKGRK